MSKKNKKSTQRKRHAHDLQRELDIHMHFAKFPFQDTLNIMLLPMFIVYQKLWQQENLLVRSPCLRTGEKLDVVKRQLKVQKKEKKQTISQAKPKKKLKGIRIRKGAHVKVPSAPDNTSFPCSVHPAQYGVITAL